MNRPALPSRTVSVAETRFKTALEGSRSALVRHRSSLIKDMSPVGSICNSHVFIKTSKGQRIEKLCGHAEWQPRFIGVTAEKFLILHSEFDVEGLDQIPLVFSLCAVCLPIYPNLISVLLRKQARP